MRLRARYDDDALVAVFGRLSPDATDTDPAGCRLVHLAGDDDHHPCDEEAPQLPLSPHDAEALVDESDPTLGTPRRRGRCRGWPLVAGGPSLTAAEQRAAAGHLEVCRDCRDHRDALARARRNALTRTAAATAVVGAGQTAALTAGGGVASAGATSVVAGKLAAVLIGTLGAAVVVGGGVAAVAQHGAADVDRVPAVHSPTEVAPAATAPPVEAEVTGCAAPCTVGSPVPIAPPVMQASPDPAAPVPPVLQLPAGGVVLVPPSAPSLPSLPTAPSLPGGSPLSSLPAVPSLPASSPLPSMPSAP